MDNKALFYVVFAVHMGGILALLHGFFSQMSKETKGIHATQFYGAIVQVVTGPLLLATASADDKFLSAWVGIKFSVALALLVTVVLGKRASGDTKKYWLIAGILTITNLIVAMAPHTK